MELKFAIGFFIGCIFLITVYKSKFKGDMGELATAVSIKNLNRDKYIKVHDIKLKIRVTTPKLLK